MSFLESSYLESERLILRLPKPSDIAAMTVWLGDYDVAKNTARVPHPYHEADAEAYVARRTPGSFVIARKADGMFLGGIGLRPEDDFEFGYWLGKPFWGLGCPPKRQSGWSPMPLRNWGRPPSMPAGFTTIRPPAMCWPSWGRATRARLCAIARRGACPCYAMTCG